MPNPFENHKSNRNESGQEDGLSADSAKSEVLPRNVERFADEIDMLDRLEATGDIKADFAAFDAIANNGGMTDESRPARTDARLLVSLRQDAVKEVGSLGEDFRGFDESRIAAITRILEKAGIKATTFEEFDFQYPNR